MLDERSECFINDLKEGQQCYSYLVRAITRGSFIVPPATAEEMYNPSIYGRSSSTNVLID